MPAVTAHDGDANASQGHGHCKDGGPAEGLAKHYPAGDCGHGRGQGHEKLPEPWAYVEVAVEQAVVPKDISHQGRKSQPEPGVAVCVNRIRPADGNPQQNGQHNRGHNQPERVCDHCAHPLAGFCGKPGGYRPGRRHHKRDYFSKVIHHCISLSRTSMPGRRAGRPDRSVWEKW